MRRQISTGIIIQKITEASFEKADQHWYYFRRAKKFPELNNNGTLRTAQTTTTKRSGVITNKLLRWHGTVDETLNEFDLCDYWHEYWEGIKNSKKIDGFWENMDETSMSAADHVSLYSYPTLHILCLLFFQALQN